MFSYLDCLFIKGFGIAIVTTALHCLIKGFGIAHLIKPSALHHVFYQSFFIVL